MNGTLGLSALVGLILVALAFDLLNGLHDAANSTPPWSPPACCDRTMR